MQNNKVNAIAESSVMYEASHKWTNSYQIKTVTDLTTLQCPFILQTVSIYFDTLKIKIHCDTSYITVRKLHKSSSINVLENMHRTLQKPNKIFACLFVTKYNLFSVALLQTTENSERTQKILS